WWLRHCRTALPRPHDRCACEEQQARRPETADPGVAAAEGAVRDGLHGGRGGNRALADRLDRLAELLRGAAGDVRAGVVRAPVAAERVGDQPVALDDRRLRMAVAAERVGDEGLRLG